MKKPVRIVPYDPRWPARYQGAAGRLREVLGDVAYSLHHIGSTSVPGLASKDRIDLQVTLPGPEVVPRLQERLQAAGLPPADPRRDHRPPGDQAPDPHWEKLYLPGFTWEGPVNVHLRFLGRRNREYPLLFRDYLRLHPAAAAAYGVFKEQLSRAIGEDRDLYCDLKDPVCDLVMAAARDWVERSGWVPPPGDP